MRTIWAVVFFIVLLAVIWFSRKVLLLLFASLLIALILTSLTNYLRKLVPSLGHKSAFGLVLVLIAGLLWGAGMLIFPPIAEQFKQLSEQLPQLASDFLKKAEQSSTYRSIEGILPDLKEMVPAGGGGHVSKVFSSTFEAISSFIFIAFTAIFLAVTPELYRKIFVKLFPPRLRDDASNTLDRGICVLKYWLLGQGVAMIVVGLAVGISLAIAGIPYAAALGLLAGLGEFIPIVGAILGGVPALLLAISQGSQTFLIILVVFLVVQLLEGNVLTPIVQRKAIDLPPVITLVALLLLGGAFGLLGMFVAAPLSALVLVLVEDLYLQKYLGTDDRILT